MNLLPIGMYEFLNPLKKFLSIKPSKILVNSIGLDILLAPPSAALSYSLCPLLGAIIDPWFDTISVIRLEDKFLYSGPRNLGSAIDFAISLAEFIPLRCPSFFCMPAIILSEACLISLFLNLCCGLFKIVSINLDLLAFG